MFHILAFFIGAMVWTISEYTLHRGWGHKGGAKNAFSVEHLHHHADTMYFAPAWKKGLAAVGIVSLLSPPLYLWLGTVGIATSVGFVVMYLTYEFIHKRLHTHAPKTRYGVWARKHHLYHHFSRPQLNHGVTSPVWDFAFKTLEVPEVIRVPRRMALPWMLDEKGDLWPEFSSDFELVGKLKTSKRKAQDALMNAPEEVPQAAEIALAP